MSRENRLAAETSPYLLQHKNNPVDWYPWGDEAFRAARERDVPIFLSIGYSTCHWCHVMERESFENPETARILNQNFISIKVDREERPDVDEVYMQAAQMMTGQGGWPLSVFLTPDLKPFYAGTYFPPQDAFGRPGFPRLLDALSRAWTERRDEVTESSKEITQAIQQSLEELASPGDLTLDLVHMAADSIYQRFDRVYGGFGQAPKFPAAFAMQVLLREHARRSDAALLEAVEETLDHMVRGGIFDQIGGGFHRYSTDPQWLVPHFEKMLYDNALMVRVLLETYQITGNADLAEAARRTLKFILREMTDPQGGFYSAIDADSEGEEGKFYVWTHDEVLEVLGEDQGKLFCKIYNITANGNFEHHANIPNIPIPVRDWATVSGHELENLVPRLEEMRRKLFDHREHRPRPHLDDKVIVSWNGLMLEAFAFAARVLQDESYLSAARRAADFLLSALRPNGALRHSWRAGSIGGPAFQEDYASLALGLVELYQADFDRHWLQEADALTREMISLFQDTEAGGFFATRDEHRTPIVRSKSPTDGVTPSGNSTAAILLTRLGRLTGQTDLLDLAEATAASFGGVVKRAPGAFDNMVAAIYLLRTPPQEIILAGDRSSEDMSQMLQTLARHFLPRAVFAWSEEGDPSTPLTEGKTAGGKPAAAFVCQNYACAQPVYTAEELAALLT